MGASRPCTPEDRAPILAWRITDRRMLTMHPATADWLSRRATCRACANYLPPVEHQKDRGGERCAATSRPIGSQCCGGRHMTLYCIDARAEGGECGPAAALFSPKGISR